MVGVLNALEYSHRMGIIHRDIKPGNIMISEQGIVKVMDFGIARALDDSAATMTQSQGVVGTAQYLSPEQARGENVDMRSDLYSAGCVLYEMLTGKPPFTGDSAVAIAYQHVSEVATPPSAIIPGLPSMWDKICAKAMAKDRQNRYATATEFRADILAFMNGGVPTAADFNPLTDLSATKAMDAGNQTGATQAFPGETTSTQAFNPLMEEFADPVPAAETRTAQRTQTKRRKRIIIGSVIAGLVVVALIVAGIIMVNRSNAEKNAMVTVPTFSQSSTEAAVRKKLEALGLVLSSKTDTDSTLPAGNVTKQRPTAGTQVKKGSTVTVWFSAGPQSVTVPTVKGMTQDEARKALEAAGFEVGSSTQTEDSADVAKDHVTRTNPDAGTSAEKGSTILLYISSGMTQVPDGLTGQSKDSALSTLHDQGFNTNVEEEYSDTVASGKVTRTNPASGSTVEQGTTITVYVSKGKEQVTVPSGINLGTTTYAEAKRILEAAGLNVSPATGNPADTDIVTAMSPQAGQTVDKGSTITLTTQAGSSPSPTTSPTTSSPATTGD
ncbi:serine-threonine protein kinase [Bifidobacterium minimum]|uniref:non-specific serine/threonine protein kinase n=2 Tax=Bifidobacterium minimum TaxID=1693 RepID=A0A087BSL7_9BIFI|nr:serine-threonine protein kinase [Bifidobacterium minimum]